MNERYVPKVSRRRTLQWFASASAGFPLPERTNAGTSAVVAFDATTNGFGVDLKKPVATWRRIMELHQLQQAAVLADTILPGSATAPAPSALGVPEFVDEWVSAPYPEQLEDRKIILDGLRWMDAEAFRRAQRSFLEVDEETRRTMVADIARKRIDPTFAAYSKFFQRFRFLVVGAYYTTPEGFKDIGYTGNAPITSYPPVTDEEREILEKALSALWL
jgi:hypothetical protein